MSLPENHEFVRSVPLADLHRHFDGSIRPETLWELSEKYYSAVPGLDFEAFRRFIERLIIHNDQLVSGPASRFSQRTKTGGRIGPLVEYRYDDRDFRIIRNRQAIGWLGIAYFLKLSRFGNRRDEGLMMCQLGTHQCTAQPLRLDCANQLGKEQGPAQRVPGTRLHEIMQHSPAHPQRPGDPP